MADETKETKAAEAEEQKADTTDAPEQKVEAKETAEDKVEEKAEETVEAKVGEKSEEKAETKTETKAKAEKKVEKKPEKKKAAKPKETKKKASKKHEAKKEEKVKTKARKPEILMNLNYFTEVRKDLPEIKPGDVLRVSYRVIEGGKERIQVFEGTVIAMKNSGITKTITVRKTSFGIAVERIFPLNSKLVQGIEIKKHSKVRRAKLYYLRNLKGKAARLKELR